MTLRQSLKTPGWKTVGIMCTGSVQEDADWPAEEHALTTGRHVEP